MPASKKTRATCQCCGAPITPSRRGRPKKFCSPACRQRAYEQRNREKYANLPSGTIVIQPEMWEAYRDDLFTLRCQAEDISTAVAEGADHQEVRQLCHEFLALAKKVEKLG